VTRPLVCENEVVSTDVALQQACGWTGACTRRRGLFAIADLDQLWNDLRKSLPRERHTIEVSRASEFMDDTRPELLHLSSEGLRELLGMNFAQIRRTLNWHWEEPNGDGFKRLHQADASLVPLRSRAASFMLDPKELLIHLVRMRVRVAPITEDATMQHCE
jgi:hypothetical protein